MIDRVVDQLAVNGVETVNLGGNEPLYTNGANPKATLLPYIIERLTDAGIIVGLTTSGITILRLYRDHRDAFDRLNDVDVSFDSPDPEEHNRNRGANIYHQAVEALEICQRHDKPHTAIMCGMKWNFTVPNIEAPRRAGQALRRQRPHQPGEARPTAAHGVGPAAGDVLRRLLPAARAVPADRPRASRRSPR